MHTNVLQYLLFIMAAHISVDRLPRTLNNLDGSRDLFVPSPLSASCFSMPTTATIIVAIDAMSTVVLTSTSGRNHSLRYRMVQQGSTPHSMTSHQLRLNSLYSYQVRSDRRLGRYQVHLQAEANILGDGRQVLNAETIHTW